ncbi:MAG: ADP-ribosylation factor-directed GTPase activating protein isoform b [Gammaproteobacteria bacterium]|nr:ADP-ribosylation factor-directed GTPase activating protein isoform b [Gammaproteobacteria bacterium]
MLAYGPDFTINVQGDAVPAVDYLLEGGRLSGWRFSPGDKLDNGRVGLRAILEPGSSTGQGHSDQWLAVLAQCNLSLDQSLQANETEYKLADYLAQVQQDVPQNAEEEWSWTLIALIQFLPTSAEWQANDGEKWSIEKIVGAEVRQALSTSACGGTHRLIGLSMALNQRRLENAKMSSTWRETQELIRDSIRQAQHFQNSDGSFSTNYFQRSGVSVDNAQVLATTGHTLEFLALSLSPDELREPWVLRAVERLCVVLEDTKTLPLECGALYHAVHGLVIYRQKALIP